MVARVILSSKFQNICTPARESIAIASWWRDANVPASSPQPPGDGALTEQDVVGGTPVLAAGHTARVVKHLMKWNSHRWKTSHHLT